MPSPVMVWAQWKTSRNQAHLTSAEQVAIKSPRPWGLLAVQLQSGCVALTPLSGNWTPEPPPPVLPPPSLAPGSSLRVAFNAASSEISGPMDLSLPSCKLGRMAVISWKW